MTASGVPGPASPESDPSPDPVPRACARRILVRSSAVLVFLIVLAVVAVIGLYRTLPADDLDVVEAGLLTVDPGAVGRHTFGDHVVVVEGGEEPSVRVEDEDRVVWSAPVGTSFVTAGRGVVDWTAHRGYFWPSVDLDERFADQEVTAVRVRRGQVVLTGTLAADEQTVAYQATFGERRGGVRLDLAATDDPDGGVTSLGLVSGRTAGAGVHGLGSSSPISTSTAPWFRSWTASRASGVESSS